MHPFFEELAELIHPQDISCGHRATWTGEGSKNQRILLILILPR
jgi:hypothetical protein